jgi:K+-sensing histidine kinase KdpD
MSSPATAVDRPHESFGELPAASRRLIRAMHELAGARDLASAIEISVQSAREIVHADGASLILREGDDCHYVAENAIGPLWKGQRFSTDGCVSGWVMAHRQAARVEDIAEDARIPYETYEPTFVKSLLVLPIGVDTAVGAIGIYWAVRHAATEMEMELIQALAVSIAGALENVKIHRTLHDQLAERTHRLEGVSRELETFSYSVAHDLQAPLRHITAYSGLILETTSGAIDDESRGWLGRIQASAAHMKEMIDALLGLAAYQRMNLTPVFVDLSTLAREQAEVLRLADLQRHVEFEIESGLVVHADESLMRTVIQTLMGNAWKFTAACGCARIRVGSSRRPDGGQVYFVGDNGVGFDMRYSSKLFTPFQRMHAAKDFPGLGIGLAAVRRIIHRHGGSIWADAAVNQGATFSFEVKKGTRSSPLGPSVDHEDR